MFSQTEYTFPFKKAVEFNVEYVIFAPGAFLNGKPSDQTLYY